MKTDIQMSRREFLKKLSSVAADQALPGKSCTRRRIEIKATEVAAKVAAQNGQKEIATLLVISKEIQKRQLANRQEIGAGNLAVKAAKGYMGFAKMLHAFIKYAPLPF